MQKKGTATIFARIFLPLFLVMLVQSAMFYLVTVYGHTVTTLDNNAMDILSERTDNRKNDIQSRLISRWGNMSFYSDAVNKLRLEYDDSIYTDSETKKSFLLESYDTLLKMIRGNSVNGVFLILSNSEEYMGPEASAQSYYGLCIRDYDPNSGYTDKEDLLVERCPSSMSSSMGCPLDAYWEATYSFNSSDKNGDFFYKPIEEASKNPGVEADNFKYLSKAHNLGDGDKSVISYSMPLIDANHKIYGVIGIELTTTYISSLLPSDELQGANSGAYALAIRESGSDELSVISTNGVLYQRGVGDSTKLQLNIDDTVQDNENIINYKGNQDLSLCLCMSKLTIYNQNTPFENEELLLIGIVQENELFSVSSQVRQTLLLVTIMVLVLGFAAIFIVSHLLTRPVKKLAAEVQSMGPDDNAKLEHIGIREIDQLVDAIENQSRKISQTKVRTEFLSRMSHDMRTPMNAVIGFSSPEILENCDKETMLSYLEKINGSGKYLLGLINEVLDMTKIDSGKMELDSKPFSLSGFWNTTVSMIDELAAKRDVIFETDLPGAGNVTVLGDDQRLSQIFVNLLSNAVKFTPSGGVVRLAVEQDIISAGELSLHVTVSDTGIGMSKEFLTKLYQPFEQEHSSREGTGLGLSIAHQLVELMGGEINCHSEEGKGTTFTVKLSFPVAAEKNLPQTVSPEVDSQIDEEDAKEVLGGKRILLCEDHPLNQQIACRILQQQNMKVEIAENGKEGLDKFSASETNYYDAVLMDIRMPVMDGIETAKAIRALSRADAGTIPIIAMTANAFKEDVEATSAAGMNAHLSKPIEPQKLYSVLASFLGKQD